MVARHVNKENGRRMTHFGCQCSFLLTSWSGSKQFSAVSFVFVIYAKLLPKAVNSSGNAAQDTNIFIVSRYPYIFLFELLPS